MHRSKKRYALQYHTNRTRFDYKSARRFNFSSTNLVWGTKNLSNQRERPKLNATSNRSPGTTRNSSTSKHVISGKKFLNIKQTWPDPCELATKQSFYLWPMSQDKWGRLAWVIKILWSVPDLWSSKHFHLNSSKSKLIFRAEFFIICQNCGISAKAWQICRRVWRQ